MKKHLFRIQRTDFKNKEDSREIEEYSNHEETDKALSQYFPLHVLEVPEETFTRKDLSVYGRDLATEWGNTLYVKPRLLNPILPRTFSSPFKKVLKRTGFDKKVVPHEILSEGGMFVFGEEFLLLSDDLIKHKEALEKLARNNGLNQPLYFVPSLTSLWHGHIDCDYQILDAPKILYVSHNVIYEIGQNDGEHIRATLEEITSNHGFELREFKTEERNTSNDNEEPTTSLEMLEESLLKSINHTKGINSIVNGRLFTNSIHPNEEEYLSHRGIKVVKVPIGKMAPGAGLRCLYGEFTTK